MILIKDSEFRENRQLAQLVEQVIVNHPVFGSIPKLSVIASMPECSKGDDCKSSA